VQKRHVLPQLREELKAMATWLGLDRVATVRSKTF
jgi:uncharacterized protein YcaQ